MPLSVLVGQFAETALRIAREVRARAFLAVRVEHDVGLGNGVEVLPDERASLGECDERHAASLAGAA